MKKSNRSFAKGCAILLAFFVGQNQMAFAGWSGLINGLGVGWVSVNVRSSTLKTNTVTTINLASPSAAMAPTAGYKTNGPLPAGASAKTFSRVQGLPGGIFRATAKAAVGDGTDNAELQSRINVTPADCASLTFDSRVVQSQEEFNANGNSGTFLVNANATAGTALWLRGFEYTGSMDDVPLDDPATVANESIEYLKTNGVVKFDNLFSGPFDSAVMNNRGAISLRFTLSSSNLGHLIIASDAVTLSLPLVVVCPSDIVVGCDEPFSYPPVQYAGCGEIAITYNPPIPAGGSFPAGAFPVGVTPVTVTATDSDGHSTNCTFTVTVTDTIPPVVPVLPVVTGGCGSSACLTAPTTTDNCCSGVITGTTTNSLVYSTAGIHKVYWTFTDGSGNSSVAIQTVIVEGLKFNGFYSPISGTGGSCASPVRICKRGDKITVKFDTKCGSSPYLLGKPTLTIEKSNSQCTSLSGCGGGNFKLDGKAWYFKWDTSDLSKATYKLTATLQDGSKQVVWIKLK